MTWVAAAVVGGAVVGGVASNAAAGKAAGAQENAANQANATSTAQFNQTRNDNAPFLANGTAGNNRLAYLLGLSTNPSLPGAYSGPSRQQILQQFENERLASPLEVPYTRLDAADRAAFDATVDERYQQAQQQYQASQAPAAAQDSNYGSLLRKFTTADLNADPVYQSGLQFGLREGEKGIANQASATGSQLSGATLKALSRFGNDYASTKANDSRNRFVADQDSTFNRLAGIAGSGQTASAQVGAAGQNYANQVSQNQIGIGNARAASAIGGANSFNNALSTGGNALMQQQLINKLGSNNNNFFSIGGGYDTASSLGGYYPYGGNNLDVGNSNGY